MKNPDIYFNGETGACGSLLYAAGAVINAARALSSLDKQTGRCFIEYNVNLKSHTLAVENGLDKYLADVFRLLNTGARAEDITLLQYLLQKFDKGTKINIDGEICTFSLKKPDLHESKILECAFKKEGMALSFATNDCWKTDFIEFQEQTGLLPNIWGQDDLSGIKSWLEHWHKKNDSFAGKLKRQFNIGVCENADFSFSGGEQEAVKDGFEKARQIKYQPGKLPVLNFWRGDKSKCGYLLELRVGNIRVFFVCRGESIIIGGVYRKGQRGNDEDSKHDLETKAAKRAIKNIDAYIEETNK
jgi:hypothetical protein